MAARAESGDRGSPVRERILATARELFYREGVRAVGVDTIVERSGVAKTSLYRWFPTKDDLIAVFLETENADFWSHWNDISKQHAGRPREELSAHLRWIGAYIRGPHYRGCPFPTAAEFPGAHPARRVCQHNKDELRRRLRDLAAAAGAADAGGLADQLALLVDGAFASTRS
jgi:AcrR family transcriptional regulator